MNDGVSYRQLGLIFLAFVLGICSALLFQNTGAGQPTTFATTELIGFVLSVLVSGASIVLAIAAIGLGRASEHAVTRRSDESIRLQNEVFAKTTDALQRIESSTGVTEKRIEDIIAGRAGDLSQEIAEKTLRGQIDPSKRDKLEENIRASLLESVRTVPSPDAVKARAEVRRLHEEREAEYSKFHDELQRTIANLNGVSVKKFGHGSPTNDEGDIHDGLYVIGDKKIAMTTFRPDAPTELLPDFLAAYTREMETETFDKYVAVLFENDSRDANDLEKAFAERVKPYRDEVSSRLITIRAHYDKIEEAAERFVEVVS